ncbi:MAG: hypothetical protein ACF8QF_12210 [Phycisphaerales bacterium]
MRTLIAIVITLLAALAGFAIVAAPASAQQNARAPRYEYAELSLRGNDAIVILADRAVYLEGPRERDPVKVANNTKLEVVIPNRVVYLTRLGDEGWELVPGQTSTAANSYLLRRAY